MSTYTTARPISLGQLADELGTDALSMSDDGTERTITCHDENVTEAQLQAAVDAHQPSAPIPSVDARLQGQFNDLIDLLVDQGVI